MGKKIAIISTLIAIFGVIVIYGSSISWAINYNGYKEYFFIRQLIYFILGIAVMLFSMRIDYHFYSKRKNLLLFIGIILLILVLIPGIGIVRNGSRSWLGYRQLGFQPSEIVKLIMIIYTAHYLCVNKNEMSKIKGLIPILLVLAIVFGLLMLEPDFGTGFITVMISMLMILLSGIKKRYLFGGIGIGLGIILILILSAPYRLQRIFAFLDPWSDPLGAGFQTIQALYAIVPHGIFGTGLFKGMQKNLFLSQIFNDFIYSSVVEQTGLIGGMGLIFAYLFLFYYGIKIALKAKDLFGTYLAVGIIISLFIQFAINLAVVLNLIPITGTTLPFISYGGSSLLINFMMVGILINIDSQNHLFL